MKAVFLADVHGNEFAFARCLQVARDLRPDIVFFLGDAVGYMPGEESVLAQLIDTGIQLQQGNHEQMLLQPETVDPRRDEVYRLNAARERMPDRMLRELSRWPTQKEWECDGKRFLLVHGSPDNPLHGYLYPDTDLSMHQQLEYEFVVSGQTHRPFIRSAGAVTFVNTGSVGLPRDVGNLGSLAMYDSETGQWKIVRFQFDAEKTIAAYGQAVHPSVVEVLRRKADKPFGDRVD